MSFRNETLSFPAGPSTPKLFAKVYDHKTLGKDRAIGEAEVDVSLITFDGGRIRLSDFITLLDHLDLAARPTEGRQRKWSRCAR